MRTLSRLMTLIVLPAMVVSSSCMSPNRKNYPPRVVVKGKVVFIPPRDADSFYFDATGGARIARAAGETLRMNRPRLKPVDFAAARGPLRSLILEEDISPDQWAAVATAAGADYLVHGSIDRIAWFDPFDRSLPRCTFTMTYSVVAAAKAREIFRTTVSGAYPVNIIADRGVTVFEMGPEGLRDRAYHYMGTVMARTFYAHSVSIFEAKQLTQSVNFAGD